MEKLLPLNDGIAKSMRSNRRKDTKPELIVRHALRDAGYSGYRLQWKVPGRPVTTDAPILERPSSKSGLQSSGSRSCSSPSSMRWLKLSTISCVISFFSMMHPYDARVSERWIIVY